MKLALFSNNKKKLAELTSIFVDMDVEVVSYLDCVDGPIDVVEDGDTFEANAIKKVEGLPERSDVIYLADDSGLVVDALDGAPGIYSARYAGEGASSEKLCQKIITEMKDNENRLARFKCAIALRFPDGTIKTVDGTCEGQIAQASFGDSGFGYDSIFVPDGYAKTFGELSSDVKQALSHRGNALRKVTAYLDSKLS
jgi:XTP/dITP diphosphohydrolase